MIVKNLRRLCKSFFLGKAIIHKKRFFKLFGNILTFFLRKNQARHFPSILNIEPTSRCDLRCALCIKGMGLLNRPAEDMSFELFKSIIDEFESSVMYLVLYFMGEPLLNPEIFKMMQYARSKNIYVRLSTNADFKDPRYIKEILDSGLNEIVISLDCASETAYSEYKKSSNFHKVLDNVRMLVEERGKKLSPFINLQFLLMRQNMGELKNFKKIAERLNVDFALIKKIRINHFGLSPKRQYLPDEKKYVRKAYLQGKNNDVRCIRPWVSTVILCDGTVVPCCFDMEGIQKFGNCRETSFSDIWKREEYRMFLEKTANNRYDLDLCQECSLKDHQDNFFKV